MVTGGRVLRQCMVVTGILALTCLPARAYHENTYHVGVVAQGLKLNTGMRSTIETVSPQTYVDDAAGYFWIGERTEAGDFIQIGYGLNTVGCGGSSGFVFAAHFDAIGNLLAFKNLGCGSAGSSGSFHVYALARSWTNGDGTSDWQAYLDGEAIANWAFTISGLTSGNNEPEVHAELSRAGLIPAGYPSTQDQMGPVRYSPAIQAWNLKAWVAAPMGIASQGAPCPPYGIGATAVNQVIIGSEVRLGSGQCSEEGTLMWKLGYFVGAIVGGA